MMSTRHAGPTAAARSFGAGSKSRGASSAYDSREKMSFSGLERRKGCNFLSAEIYQKFHGRPANLCTGQFDIQDTFQRETDTSPHWRRGE